MLLIALANLAARAQIVDIPDANLKFTLITYPVADLGNGFNEIADTNGDGEIQITEAEAVIGLQLIEQFIEDLEGLQYFTNLEWINIAQNSFLDYVPTTFWPNLSYLHCGQNDISNLDITQNPLLEVLILDFNPLTSIDVTQNSLLKELSLSGCQLPNLDISQNILLEILHCNGNQLTSLDIHNENNSLLWSMIATNNPNLTCIQVDDVAYANAQTNWHKDETAIYSEDCSLGIEDVLAIQIIVYPNPVQNVLYIENNSGYIINSIQIADIASRIMFSKKGNTSQFDLSQLNTGVYFIKIAIDNGILIKQFVKK